MGKSLTQPEKKPVSPIVKNVTVNRNRTPQEVLAATGLTPYVSDRSILLGMPAGGTGVEKNVAVTFFIFDGAISDDELALEYEKRDLKPDPYAVAAVSEADPSFAYSNDLCAHWKDDAGRWCFIAIDDSRSDRGVTVGTGHLGWCGPYWCGGVQKMKII